MTILDETLRKNHDAKNVISNYYLLLLSMTRVVVIIIPLINNKS